MKISKTRGLVLAGVIAAIYAGISFLPGISMISFGPVQLRLSEALCSLAMLSPWAIPGLAIGCFITNLASPMMMVDLPFGTLATLIAAIFTYLLRKKPFIALLMPVVANGIIVGTIITFFIPGSAAIWLNMLTVAAGEAAVCYIFGYPLYKVVDKALKRH